MFFKKKEASLKAQVLRDVLNASNPQVPQLKRFEVVGLILQADVAFDDVTPQNVGTHKLVIDSFYDMVSQACYEAGGDVMNMFQGRCYCVFGCPQRLGQLLQRAEKASRDVVAAWRAAHGHIPLRSAIEAGELYCGMFGTKDRRTYEGIGDVFFRAEKNLLVLT